MYVRRKLEQIIQKYLNRREYLAIVGPRQAGKTTMLQNIQKKLNNSIFLTFEDIDILRLFETDIKAFVQTYQHYKYIFIDEFQYAKNGGKHLKYIYDLYPNIKIIISGSSAIDITIKAVKFLVGRIFIFELFPFDFDEFISCKDKHLYMIYQDIIKGINIKKNKIKLPKINQVYIKQFNKLLEEFIIYGGYPSVVLSSKKVDKIMILKNIYNTYFLRDIQNILFLANDFKFIKLLKALSIQMGQLVEFSNLCQITEYDMITLKKYINILEKTYICSSIKPFFKNKQKEIVKNPKFYFVDNGFRNYVLNDFNFLENRIDKGFLYENFIFTQLLKQELLPNFWRTKSKLEVDFVIRPNQIDIIPIECKSLVKTSEIPASFKTFLNDYKVKTGIILNENIVDKIKCKNTSIYFLPYVFFQ